jgi:hypothetical protein
MSSWLSSGLCKHVVTTGQSESILAREHDSTLDTSDEKSRSLMQGSPKALPTLLAGPILPAPQFLGGRSCLASSLTVLFVLPTNSPAWSALSWICFFGYRHPCGAA